MSDEYKQKTIMVAAAICGLCVAAVMALTFIELEGAVLACNPLAHAFKRQPAITQVPCRDSNVVPFQGGDNTRKGS